MSDRAKPKATGTPRATRPRRPDVKSKSPTKAGAKAERRASAVKQTVERGGSRASRLADAREDRDADWREETLARMRALILEADPDMVEERKWRKPSNAMTGIPVWSHHGIVCTGETYKGAVKLTFARGASLADPARLFNASLEGSTRRAIDLREGETVDARAFKALVKAAVALNRLSAKGSGP